MTGLAVVSAETESAQAAVLYVVFKIDGADYALPVEVVLQMESYSGATHVPGAPAFVAGVIQVRGRVVPVIDLRARFGLPPVQHTSDSRVVVGQHGTRAVALSVDSAREVVKLTPEQVKPPPPLVDGSANGFVKGTVQLGPRMIFVLDFAKVIAEESLDGIQR